MRDEKVSGPHVTAYWRGKALSDFTTAPGRFLKTYFTKLGIFFSPSEPPAGIDQRFIARHSVLLRTHVFTFGVIAPIGLVGLAIAARRRSLYAAVLIPGFAVLASVFLISDSEKLLVVPFLAVFAGCLVEAVVSGVRRHDTVKAVSFIGAAAIVGVLLWLLPKHDLNEARQLVMLGDVYSEEALFDKAEEAYGQAMDLAPDAPEAYVSLASLYGNSGKLDSGIQVLQRAASGGIRDPRVTIEKASLLIMAKRQAEAIQALLGAGYRVLVVWEHDIRSGEFRGALWREASRR